MATAILQGVQTANAVQSYDAEDLQLFDQILKLRDDVLKGVHNDLQLSAADIQSLRDSVRVSRADRVLTHQPITSSAKSSFNHPLHAGAEGPRAAVAVANSDGAARSAFAAQASFSTTAQGSKYTVSGDVKETRRRIEADVKMRADTRRYTHRGKNHDNDTQALDVDAVLKAAFARVHPVTGLQPLQESGHRKSISFDTDDYYSSRAPSEKSSHDDGNEEVNKADTIAGPFANGEIISKRDPLPADRPQPDHFSHGEHIDLSISGDEEDDYVPPDPEALIDLSIVQGPPTYDDSDDESEYEPDEPNQSNTFFRSTNPLAAQTMTPNGMSITRSQVTEIVAPQPNRISSLVVANGQSKADRGSKRKSKQGKQAQIQVSQINSSQHTPRTSSASPTADGMASGSKKKRNKKRKREVVPPPKASNKKQKNNVDSAGFALATPVQFEPRIKEEPVSPPAFNALQPAPYIGRRNVDPSSFNPSTPAIVLPKYNGSRQGPPKQSMQGESSSSSQTPPNHRPRPRDNLDLRRVATMHNVHQPASRAALQHPYSPSAPAAGFQSDLEYNPARPLLSPALGPSHAARYHDASAYIGASRGRSVSEQLPPAASSDPAVFVDEYGRRYYREPDLPEQAPTAAYRAPPTWSQPYANGAYQPAQPPPTYGRQSVVPYVAQPQWDVASRQYMDLTTPQLRTLPLHEPHRGPQYAQPMPPPPAYDTMLPPPLPQPSYTDPGFAIASNLPHMYADGRRSALPERQASIAPPQYFRQDAAGPPLRAASVMPQMPYAARDYSLPPAPLPPAPIPAISTGPRFVDRYGREVFAEDVRQVGQYRYPE